MRACERKRSRQNGKDLKPKPPFEHCIHMKNISFINKTETQCLNPYYIHRIRQQRFKIYNPLDYLELQSIKST